MWAVITSTISVIEGSSADACFMDWLRNGVDPEGRSDKQGGNDGFVTPTYTINILWTSRLFAVLPEE